MNLRDLQYLKHLNSIRGLVLVALIIGGIYLIVKSPKIKTTMEVDLYKVDSNYLKIDTLKQDTI